MFNDLQDINLNNSVPYPALIVYVYIYISIYYFSIGKYYNIFYTAVFIHDIALNIYIYIRVYIHICHMSVEK